MRASPTLFVALASLTALGCGASSTVGEPDVAAPPHDASLASDAPDAPDADPGTDPDAATQTDAATPTDARVPTDTNMPRADSGPTGPMVVERTYRLLHWNIAGGAENACQTAGITRAIRRYVAEHDVDFVGLNEVCPAQHDAIEAALREHWGLGPRADFAAYVGDGVPNVVGNSIFSRFGLQNVTRDRLGEDMYGARNLLCGQVPDLPHVRMCSAHLTPADATAREQLGRVLDRIEQWWMNRSDTVLLTGDLNLTADHAALNTVYAPGADTRNNPDNRGHYRELDDNDPDHCIGYGERSQPGTAGGPCAEGGKIDFIFVRANRIVDGNYAGDTFDIPTDCTGACSDHRAVFGRVRVRVAVD